MKTVTYHIAKATDSQGRPRADTMVRIEIDGQWDWFTGFADAASALAFVRELVGNCRVKLVSVAGDDKT